MLLALLELLGILTVILLFLTCFDRTNLLVKSCQSGYFILVVLLLNRWFWLLDIGLVGRIGAGGSSLLISWGCFYLTSSYRRQKLLKQGYAKPLFVPRACACLAWWAVLLLDAGICWTFLIEETGFIRRIFVLLWLVVQPLVFLYSYYVKETLANYQADNHQHSDYVIVLGSYVRQARMTAMLQSRLDLALAYQRQFPLGNRPILVVSGGKKAGADQAEAIVMRDYLLTAGVPHQEILLEKHARNTFENLMFTKEKVLVDWQSRTKDDPCRVVVVTSDYHLMRVLLYARQIDFKIWPLGAATPRLFLPHLLLREYRRLLSYYRMEILLFILIEIILSFTFIF